MTRRARSAAAFILVASVGALPACGVVPGAACTEIGYTNQLDIRFAPAIADDVAAVELCYDDACIDSSSARDNPHASGATDDGGWAFALFVGAPSSVTIRAFDASGTELVAASEYGVHWVATDDPNGPGCDNRSIASPITVE